MTDPSAESRDRAIAEANALRQENAELREALERMTHYAQCALDQFKEGRGHFDISGFHCLVPYARALLAKPRP